MIFPLILKLLVNTYSFHFLCKILVPLKCITRDIFFTTFLQPDQDSGLPVQVMDLRAMPSLKGGSSHKNLRGVNKLQGLQPNTTRYHKNWVKYLEAIAWNKIKFWYQLLRY